MKLKRIISAIITAAIALTMLPMGVSAAKKGITLNNSSVTILEGKSCTIRETVTGFTKYTVQWSTSDKAVATVSKGKITAQKEGTATITAKIKDTDLKATCKVTVKKTASNTDTTDRSAAREFVSNIKVGWNLGNSLDSVCDWLPDELDHETGWGNVKTTEGLITAVKKAGFNTVRIPVSWGGHIDKNGKISKAWLDRVQEVVDYAYNNDMYVILNSHHDDDWIKLDAASEKKVTKIYTNLWKQIANRFKDYDEKLIFEGRNEPRTQGTSTEWTGGTKAERDVLNRMNKAFVDTVRATGGNNKTRFLMITPYGAVSTSYTAMAALELPADERIIVSVHSYAPGELALYGDINYKTFDQKGKNEIDWVFDNINKAYISKGIPVIMGECGFTDRDNEAERIKGYKYYLSTAKKYGIPCVIWDNGGVGVGNEKYGLINRSTYEWYFPRIIKAIMNAVK